MQKLTLPFFIFILLFYKSGTTYVGGIPHDIPIPILKRNDYWNSKEIHTAVQEPIIAGIDEFLTPPPFSSTFPKRNK